MTQNVVVNQNTSGGVGFLGLLTIVFIVLKILGHITWSWWWVFSPLWIPFAVVLGFLGIVGIIALLAAIIAAITD